MDPHMGPPSPHLLRVEVRGQHAADVGHGVTGHMTNHIVLHYKWIGGCWCCTCSGPSHGL